MAVAPLSYKCWDHPDLVAGYDPTDTFTEGGKTYVRDKSGNGFHARFTGVAPTYMPSILPAKRKEGGKSFYQVGVVAGNNYLYIASDNKLQGSEMTAIGFCRVSAGGDNEWLFYKNGAWALGELNPSAWGAVRAYIWGKTPASGDVSISSASSPSAYQTMMMAATWDTTDTRIYVNGECYSILPTTGTPTQSANALNIGGAVDDNFYYGCVDNLLIFNRVLSATEIREIWDSAMLLPRVWGTVKVGEVGNPMNLCRSTDLTGDPYWPYYWNNIYGAITDMSHVVEDGYDVIQCANPIAAANHGPWLYPGSSTSIPYPLQLMYGSGFSVPMAPDRADYMKYEVWFDIAPDADIRTILTYGDYGGPYYLWSHGTVAPAKKWTELTVPFSTPSSYLKNYGSVGELAVRAIIFHAIYSGATTAKMKLRNIRFGKYGWNSIDFNDPKDLARITTTRYSGGGENDGSWTRTLQNGRLYYASTSGGTESGYWGPLERIDVGSIKGDCVFEMKFRMKRTNGSFGYGMARPNQSTTLSFANGAGLINPGGASVYFIGYDSSSTTLRLSDILGNDITVIIRHIRRNGVLTEEIEYGGSTNVLGSTAYTTTITTYGFFVNWLTTANLVQEYWIDYIRWREL